LSPRLLYDFWGPQQTNRAKARRSGGRLLICRRILITLLSDDELMNTMVLKGGNALAMFHEIGNRTLVGYGLLDREPIAGPGNRQDTHIFRLAPRLYLAIHALHFLLSRTAA
jgi:hypothetical protein